MLQLVNVDGAITDEDASSASGRVVVDVAVGECHTRAWSMASVPVAVDRCSWCRHLSIRDEKPPPPRPDVRVMSQLVNVTLADRSKMYYPPPLFARLLWMLQLVRVTVPC